MPYVRMRHGGTIGALDLAAVEGQRLFIADNPMDTPPDRLLQTLLSMRVVDLDPDQSAPLEPRGSQSWHS